MSLLAVRRIYENGVVHPLGPLPNIPQSQVIITFLVDEPAGDFETFSVKAGKYFNHKEYLCPTNSSTSVAHANIT